MASLAKFPHRRDRDGLYDSICPNCFATVARSKPEAEMAELEKAHVCNTSYLAERGQFTRAKPPGPSSPAIQTRIHILPGPAPLEAS
jgi:hypothetical protein